MDQTTTTTPRVSIDLRLPPAEAFKIAVDELALTLAQDGLAFEPGPAGRVVDGAFPVGHVITWAPGEEMRLEWHPADWAPGETTTLVLRCEPLEGGTRVTVEQQGWGALLGGPDEEAGWFASAVAAPFLRATTPRSLGAWLTDRRARRPTGAQARATYRDPLYHYPNFQAILSLLALTPGDNLLEVGCGGGAFLKLALASGCRAAAVDHSLEMVRLAQHENAQAVADGRLTVEYASADHLPFPDARFTCAVMTGVLGFLPDAVAAFREMWRVLAAGGRMVVLGTEIALRGTPAAPEPMASQLHWYDDTQLQSLAEEAGFADARVVHVDLLSHARQVGIPEDALPLFTGQGAPFLVARKTRE